MKFAEMFVQKIKEKSSGAIEATEGKKRWVFFFEEGDLVMTRSNLKSEQGAALRAAHPGADLQELAYQQSLIRVKKACGKLVQLQAKEGVAPKKLPIFTHEVFVDGFSATLGEEEILSMCAGFQDKKIENSGELNFKAVELNAFLGSFDGYLTAITQVNRSSIPSKTAWLVLLYGMSTGLLSSEEEEEEENVFDFDLDDILQEDDIFGIEESATPAQTSEAAAEEEPPEEPVKPAKHPMADELSQLDERISHAENHFQVLGVHWESSVDDFRKAHRDLSLKLHPDRYVDASEDMQQNATELFDKIREAWEIISNDEEREKYINSKIHGIKTEEEEAMEQLQAYWAGEESFKRGMALFNQGRTAPAHENFTKAAELCPEELEFKAYYGYTTFATNRSSNMERAMEGIDIIREVIDLNQSQERKLDSAWMLIGRAYREAEKPEKAKRALMKALKLNPSNADAKRELRRIVGSNPNKKSDKKKEEAKPKKGGLFGFWGKK